MKPYPAYKDSGIEWIGEIPEHWDTGKLKYGLTRNDGGAWGSDFDDDGVIVLRSTEIKLDGSWNIDEPARRALTETEIDKTKLKKGDLLITKSSGSEKHIGKTALVNEDIENINACFSNFMQRIRPDNGRSSRYLHYFLNSNLAREQYNYLSQTTTGLANLSAEIISDIQIPFLSLLEQKAIVDFLDRKTSQIGILIEKKRKQIDLLKEQRQAVINQAVTKGLDPDVEMKDSGIDWLGKIPKHWEVVKLKYLGEAILGLTYSPDDIVQDGTKGLLVLRASNIQNGKLSLEDNVYVNKAVPNKLITQIGDILICSRSGSRKLIGKNICIDDNIDNCTFGVFMTIFRTEYWRYLSKVFNSLIFTSQAGLYLTSTINQLTVDTLNSLIIAIPPTFDEQQIIVDFLDEKTALIDNSIDKAQNQIELLQEYRTALISEAVTRKIDVREK